jgi:hypothetical protein
MKTLVKTLQLRYRLHRSHTAVIPTCSFRVNHEGPAALFLREISGKRGRPWESQLVLAFNFQHAKWTLLDHDAHDFVQRVCRSHVRVLSVGVVGWLLEDSPG